MWVGRSTGVRIVSLGHGVVCFRPPGKTALSCYHCLCRPRHRRRSHSCCCCSTPVGSVAVKADLQTASRPRHYLWAFEPKYVVGPLIRSSAPSFSFFSCFFGRVIKGCLSSRSTRTRAPRIMLQQGRHLETAYLSCAMI